MYTYVLFVIALLTSLHALLLKQQYESRMGTRLSLNRLVFSESEIFGSSLTLPADDYRSKHLYNILKADVDCPEARFAMPLGKEESAPKG